MLATRTIIVSLLTGTLVTLVASIVPALRATRVPPISAVREGSTADAPAGPAAAPHAGARSSPALRSPARPRPVRRRRGGLVALTLVVGVLALFVGIAMLAPRLVKPLAALVGLPAARLGGSAGRLARENSVRNPGRTASTAAALMIGLALVTVVATLGAGLRGSTESAVKKQVNADYVVTAKDGGGSFPAASDEAHRAAAGVEAISGVRSDTGQGRRRRVAVSGIDAKTIEHFYSFDWTAGLARRARRRRRDRREGLRRRSTT